MRQISAEIKKKKEILNPKSTSLKRYSKLPEGKQTPFETHIYQMSLLCPTKKSSRYEKYKKISSY